MFIPPTPQPRTQPMTVFQKIIDHAGEGQNLETVPAHLFFRIFDRQMDRIKMIFKEANIPDRSAEQVTFQIQLNGEKEVDRHLHELICVVASRRMIETQLLHHEFYRPEDLNDGHTFCDPMLEALPDYKIQVTLYRRTFRRRRP